MIWTVLLWAATVVIILAFGLATFMIGCRAERQAWQAKFPEAEPPL